jgi:hypothetical protein
MCGDASQRSRASAGNAQRGTNACRTAAQVRGRKYDTHHLELVKAAFAVQQDVRYCSQWSLAAVWRH